MSKFMQHAIAIANMAVGTTAPNPPVGCVIVKEGRVIAAAHTGQSGRPHAETIALEAAGQAAKGADAYVTLEPCAHYGKTPPCALALIEHGIKRVFIAQTDPFPAVNGAGIKMLQDAGVEVITGLCSDAANYLNEGFFSVQQRGRPFITLKTATSLDGKIALKNGASKWITGEESRAYAHLMRAKTDAIITGIATVMADNPMLNCRLPGLSAQSPIRVVLDTNLNLPESCKLVESAGETPCWVVTLASTIENKSQQAAILQQKNVKLIPVNQAKNGKICLEDTVAKLAQNNITTAIIEAGTNINSAAMQLGLVDRIAWFSSPLIIGNDGMPAFADKLLENMDNIDRFRLIKTKNFGDDVLRVYDVVSGTKGAIVIPGFRKS